MKNLTNERLAFESVNDNAVNFRDLFESLSVMFYVENFVPKYELEYISPAFESLGYTVEEIYADPKILDRVMHPDDLLMMKEANKELYNQTKTESDYAYRVFRKNGEMRWWKDRGRPIFNEKGERVKWFGVITDITDQKTAEQNLLESKIELEHSSAELAASYETTQTILESIGDLLVVVNDDGKIEKVNDAAEAMLGYEKSEFVGKHVRMLTQTETFLTEEEFELMKRVGKLVNVEKNLICRNGDVLKAVVTSSILTDRYEAAVIVAKDISDIVKAKQEIERSNEKLRQSNRELQDFAYVASHDLQEPLRKIRAFGDRLEKKFAEGLGAEGSDYISRMQNAAVRMQTLINDLLTFSRVATKTQPFQATDISQIAQGVISDLEVRIEETKGSVEIEPLPVIDADPLQMRQLFQNLIGNALKFHRAGEPPRVRVSSNLLESDGDNAQLLGGVNYPNAGKKLCQIVVQDNGIGFDEKYLDKIFTVFQRLHGRGTYEGSGIGLSVCRKIVERHGGEITACSQPDRGSTFLITLPVKQSQEESFQL